MTVNGVYSVVGIASVQRRSTTGMIEPRRFITPLIWGGVFGIGVIGA